jgi:RNA-directed DNA polymerase
MSRFNIRRYPNGKLLTKPSKATMIRIRARLGQEIARLNGANAQAVIGTLNPIIRGWANYFRTGVSQRSYNQLDNWLFHRLWRWALRRHPNKGLGWIKDRYWGRYRVSRNDHWVFGDRDTGQHLTKAAWTPIIRHIKVKGRASPDDPALAQYWQRRRQRPALPPPAAALGLA